MTALRLALGATRGEDRLDGGWWPHSRDLATELVDLVDSFPPEHGRIVGAAYSASDWGDAPRRVSVHGRDVEVRSLPPDDTHVIRVTTSRPAVFCLLVIPSTFDEAQGSEALLAASTRGNHHSADALLRVVTNELPVDPAGQWTTGSG